MIASALLSPSDTAGHDVASARQSTHYPHQTKNKTAGNYRYLRHSPMGYVPRPAVRRERAEAPPWSLNEHDDHPS